MTVEVNNRFERCSAFHPIRMAHRGRSPLRRCHCHGIAEFAPSAGGLEVGCGQYVGVMDTVQLHRERHIDSGKEACPMDRARVMEEAIHSGEMEGAYVSAEFRRDADEYVRGDIPIEELMRRTKRRWDPKRKTPGHA